MSEYELSDMSGYELQRLENIRRNQEVLSSLGLDDAAKPPPKRPSPMTTASTAIRPSA